MTEAIGFLGYYDTQLERPQNVGIRITSQGMFVENGLLPALFESYRLWLQKESNSGRLLEVKHVEEKLLGENLNKEFYLPEGKLVWVGKLLPATTLGTSNKIPKYEGTLIDAATLLHPKDPLFVNGTIHNITTPNGPEISVQVLGEKCSFAPALIKSFFELAKKLPRIRRRHPKALHSLRGAVETLSLLLSRARPVLRENLIFVPGKLRAINLGRLVTNNGVYFVLSNDKAHVEGCFSPVGGAVAKLIREEIEELKKTAKRGRVGGIEFSKNIPQIVGFIHSQQDRFTVSYRVLDDFFKLRGFKSDEDPKDKHIYTCFDLVLRLSREFESSVWMLPQDVLPSQRGKGKDQWLFRASKNYLFHISKQRQIVGVLRRGKRPVSNIKLTLKPIEERRRELAEQAKL